MKDAHSISTRRAYGVQRVCRVWHRARSSVYARRQATTSRAPCRRRGPVGAAPDDVLAGHIANCSKPRPFTAKGTGKPGRSSGSRGLERVRRLMREHDLQAPHRVGHAHGPKAHDGTITTAAPDVMWGTDMTATVTVGEGAAFVSAPRWNGCVDAGARSRPRTAGPRARPEGARRHDHHRGPRCDVGHGMTATVTCEGAAFVFVAVADRVHRPACGQARDPI